jgi:hypothetical protein
MLIFIIIFTGILLFLFLNLLYKKSRHYYLTEGQHCNRIKNGAYDIVNLGSSYSRYGFDYEKAELKGYNLGISGQFFYYTDLMLKQYSPWFNKDCVVVIIIADLVFARVGKGMYKPERYTAMIDKDLLGDEYSKWKYFSRVVFPLVGNPRLLFALLKEYYNIIRKKVRNNMLVAKNPYDEEGALKQAKERCESWCEQFSLVDTKSDKIDSQLDNIFQETRKILTDMIQFCLDKGFRPVLVVTPVSHALNSLLSEKFIQRVLFDNIDQANKQNIPLFNYLRDERFQDIKWYLNADMLNLKGRRKFTEVVIEDLKAIDYFI